MIALRARNFKFDILFRIIAKFIVFLNVVSLKNQFECIIINDKNQ